MRLLIIVMLLAGTVRAEDKFENAHKIIHNGLQKSWSAPVIGVQPLLTAEVQGIGTKNKLPLPTAEGAYVRSSSVPFLSEAPFEGIAFVTKINDMPITSPEDVDTWKKTAKPGEEATFSIKRFAAPTKARKKGAWLTHEVSVPVTDTFSMMANMWESKTDPVDGTVMTHPKVRGAAYPVIVLQKGQAAGEARVFLRLGYTGDRYLSVQEINMTARGKTFSFPKPKISKDILGEGLKTQFTESTMLDVTDNPELLMVLAFLPAKLNEPRIVRFIGKDRSLDLNLTEDEALGATAVVHHYYAERFGK